MQGQLNLGPVGKLRKRDRQSIEMIKSNQMEYEANDSFIAKKMGKMGEMGQMGKRIVNEFVRCFLVQVKCDFIESIEK